MELSVGLAQQSSFSVSLGHGPHDDLSWTNAQRENIRARLIRLNFENNLPQVWSLGKMKVEQDLRSRWQTLQSTVRNTSLEQWMMTALILSLFVGSIAAIPIGVRYGTIFLNNRYTQMTLGTLYWFDRSGYRIRPYNKIDFFIERIQVVFIVAMTSFFLLVGAFGVFLNHPSFFSVYEENRYVRAIQQIDLTDSSMKDFPLEDLTNNSEGSGWTDAFSLETIPAEKVLSPRVFLINRYAIGLLPFLRYVFQKDFESGKVSHFAQHGDMDAGTEEKFLRDVTRLFSITREDFFECSKVYLWIINQQSPWPVLINEGALVASRGPLNEEFLNLFNLARKVAFLKLLPPKIVDEYFSGFLSDPEKEVARELIQNPKRFNYKPIFGDARFNKDLLIARSD